MVRAPTITSLRAGRSGLSRVGAGVALVMALVAALAFGGCFSAPEACNNCRAGRLDAGVDTPSAVDARDAADRTSAGGSTGTGGTTGTGGVTGAGGATASGGTTGTGGATGVGGATGTGGLTGAGGAATGGAGGGIDANLVAWYRLDETTGTTAADSSGHGLAATLTSVGTGSATFSTVHEVGTGSVNLTSTSATVGGFIRVPASLQAMGATTAITISCWVNLRTARPWQRVFDFGSSSTTTYMFLTTQDDSVTPNAPYFAITRAGNQMQQTVRMTTAVMLSTGVWHHLAVVLGPGATYTGTLYVDKVPVGSNVAMTYRPSDLGASINNWIGRSQFSASDPLFDGQIDDFRIYKSALTAAEIAALP
jgi:Concanavalin A-like lectin/glucanases superfamily